jgi:hypothetical protein
LAEQTLQLGDASRILMYPAMARKGLVGLLEMLLAPPDHEGGMDLILTGGLGGSFPRLDLAHHLQLELAGKTTSFQSQGRGLLSP